MSISWRPTLVQMQAVLSAQGSPSAGIVLPPSTSQTGYTLLSLLNARGQAYDASADDGATNTSSTAATTNSYVAQASPVFTELDRFCRYIYSLYATSSTMTPAIALSFGVVTQAQAAAWQTYVNDVAAGITPPTTAYVPTFQLPVALVFDRTGGNFTTLAGRSYSAGLLCANNSGQSTTLATAQTAWTSGVWYDPSNVSHPLTTPPTNSNVAGEANSVRLTALLSNTLAECTTWLAAIQFN